MTREDLIKKYKKETGKSAFFKWDSNKNYPKQSFLKWNIKQIKEKKTRTYYEIGKLYNPVSNRFVKPKYDKRYKKQTLSKAFKKKFNVEGSLAVPINDDIYLFNVKHDENERHIFNDEKTYNDEINIGAADECKPCPVGHYCNCAGGCVSGVGGNAVKCAAGVFCPYGSSKGLLTDYTDAYKFG